MSFIDALAEPGNQEGLTYVLVLNTLVAGGIAVNAFREGNIGDGLQAANLTTTLGVMALTFARGADAGYAEQTSVANIPANNAQTAA